MSEFTHLRYDPIYAEPRWKCDRRLQEMVYELERNGYHPAPHNWKRAFVRGVPKEHRILGPHLNAYRHVQCEDRPQHYYRFPIPYNWDEVVRFLFHMRSASWNPKIPAEERKLECVKYLWGRPAVVMGAQVIRGLK